MIYDVVIIGGGITGAGVLRDCALRGLRCLLLEKNRPGGGTTAASTHLIHGGLRYLLYDRLTTHTTCWDSGNIVRIARPLLTRLPIVWPVYRGHRHGLETVETLLESYDAFQRMKLGRPHLRLSADEAARLVPGLARDGLSGALVFDEWWVDPVALVEANLASARAAGSEILTGARVVGVRRGADGMEVSAERADGRRFSFGASLVVNAAGPWADVVARLAGARIPLRLRKGTHLVYDSPVPALTASGIPLGLLLEAEDRDRYVFVVPIGREVLVGPTDIAFGGDPDALASSPEEARYLLTSARRYLPSLPERFDRTLVGARPILGQAGSEKLLSREYEVFDHAGRDGLKGLLTVAGGKLSDFRLMGQDAGNAVCQVLGREAPCRTHLETLDGHPVGAIPDFPRPWRPLKRFLRGHPRLRELHALAYLGGGLGRHLLRRVSGGARLSTVEQFRAHYADGAPPGA